MVNTENRQVRKFDPTKPVRTRDGRPARIICTDRDGEFSIVGLVKGVAQEYIYTYRKDGTFSSGNVDVDLVNIPEKVKVHVYQDKATKEYWASNTKYDPPKYSDLIKTVEIEV